MTSDAAGRILSLECDKGDDFAYVDAERVQRGDLDSFLPFVCWKGKKAYEFAYRVGACVSLKKVLAAPIDFTYLRAITTSLLHMMRQCEESGLSRLRVMLDLEHVFLDYGVGALKFVYVPMNSYASPGGESDFLIRLCRAASASVETQPFFAAMWDYACRTSVVTRVGFEAFLLKWGVCVEAGSSSHRSHDGIFAAGGARDDKGWDFVSAAKAEQSQNIDCVGHSATGFSPNDAANGAAASDRVLRCLTRLSSGVEFHLGQGLYTLGRSSDCSIALTDARGVSRKHAELVIGDEVDEICDLNSTNGVYVNGNRIPSTSRVKIKPGDRIALGDEEFLIDAAC